MNIFILSEDPTEAAQLQCDKHVVKMVLETAQLLSTVKHQYGEPAPYKATHANHPCTKWAAHSLENFQWLHAHGMALGDEYTYRYGKQHKSHTVIQGLQPPVAMPSLGLTPFALAVPGELRSASAVTTYREYYRQHKISIAAWTKRVAPSFMASV
jgi:hypothetical protein